VARRGRIDRGEPTGSIPGGRTPRARKTASGTGGRSPARSTAELGYLEQSRRPLPVLAFVLPLVIAYELALTASTFDDLPGIAARGLLAEFFDLFGVAGLHVPAAVLIVSLLCIQIARHGLRPRAWRFGPLVPVGIAVEGAALALPLVMFSALAGGIRPAAAWQAATGGEAGSIAETLALAIGAGLYEDLVSRMVGCARVGVLMGDRAGLSRRVWIPIGLVVTAAAFAAFHGPPGQNGSGYGRFLFYIFAGVYFGLLYIARGFGVAVGAHTIYDVIALMPGD